MSRLEVKLTQTIEEKDYYQALQLYKTLYARYRAKNPRAAEELLVRGALALLEHQQVCNFQSILFYDVRWNLGLN